MSNNNNSDENLYHRICTPILFAQNTNEYIIQNRHPFSDSFSQEHINWFGSVVDFLREQGDILEFTLFRNGINRNS